MKKFWMIQRNKGMTYVELIVVLSIFSVMTSVVIFNYGDFQSRVDIKNLASDIALKVVEAQNSSLTGKLPPLAQQAQITSAWKPSYGIYINSTSNNKRFVFFTDLNQDGFLANANCVGVNECLDDITITGNNTISSLDVFYQNGTSDSLNDLTITFLRPNSGVIIKSSSNLNPNISYVQITIVSSQGTTANVKVYASGRIQIN